MISLRAGACTPTERADSLIKDGPFLIWGYRPATTPPPLRAAPPFATLTNASQLAPGECGSQRPHNGETGQAVGQVRLDYHRGRIHPRDGAQRTRKCERSPTPR